MKIVSSILALLFSFNAVAQEGVITERGFFSLSLMGAYASSSFLNQDGSHSGFTGYQGATQLGIKLFGSGAGETQFFAQYGLGAEESTVNSDKMSRNEFLGGIQVWSNPYLFFNLGYGSAQIKYKSAIRSTGLKYNFTSIGGGFNFPIGNSFAINLHLQYKNGAIPNTSDSALSGNSQFQGIDTYLGITWSPPLSNVYTK